MTAADRPKPTGDRDPRRIMARVVGGLLVAAAMMIVGAGAATAQPAYPTQANPSPDCLRIAFDVFNFRTPCGIHITEVDLALEETPEGVRASIENLAWERNDSPTAGAVWPGYIMMDDPGPVSVWIDWGDGSEPIFLDPGAAITPRENGWAYDGSFRPSIVSSIHLGYRHYYRGGSTSLGTAFVEDHLRHLYTSGGRYTVTVTTALWLTPGCAAGMCPPAGPPPHQVLDRTTMTVDVAPFVPTVSFATAPPRQVDAGETVPVDLRVRQPDRSASYNLYIGWDEDAEPTLVTPTGVAPRDPDGPADLLFRASGSGSALQHAYPRPGEHRVWARAVPCTYSSIVGAPCVEDGSFSNVSTVSRFVEVGPGTLETTISGRGPTGDVTLGYTPNGVPGVVDLTGTLRCTHTDDGDAIDDLPYGEYTIDLATCSGLDLTYVDATDEGLHRIVGTGGELIVDPAPRPVQVAGTQTYGDFNPVFTHQVPDADHPAEVVGTEVVCVRLLDGTPTMGAPGVLSVGTHLVDPASCTGLAGTGPAPFHYALDYGAEPIELEVRPATVTVTAGDGAMVYGDEVPIIVPIYDGFVLDEGPEVLTAAPSCTVQGRDAGTRVSLCHGTAAADYTFVHLPGTVEVAPAELTVTPQPASFVSGGDVPAILPSYDGFVPGEGPEDLAAAPTCDTEATRDSGVGTYASGCSGGEAANYRFTHLPGTVTVTAPDGTPPVDDTEPPSEDPPADDPPADDPPADDPPADRCRPVAFRDVPASHPHATTIDRIARACIVSGFTDGTYRPGQPVTRGQVATLLANALELSPGSARYPDVPPHHPHARGISALGDIASGFDDGTFRPEAPITRAQMATLLVNAAGLPDGTMRFTDVPDGYAHADAIAAVGATGIRGFADGTYRPHHQVTRGQMATFLVRTTLDPT